MGWSYGINEQGREVGYAVEAECDTASCNAQIDRGLAYVCGGMHDGGEFGCGRYFCPDHLFLSQHPVFVCRDCLLAEEAEGLVDVPDAMEDRPQ